LKEGQTLLQPLLQGLEKEKHGEDEKLDEREDEKKRKTTELLMFCVSTHVQHMQHD
jgi:hypothetical protein